MIVQNNVTENAGVGIGLVGSEKSLIHNNRIGWNSGGNARDDGSDNQWDDGVGAGNYWSDYDGYGEYEITGEAGSKDRYPFSLGLSPFLDHPADIEYIFGTDEHSITWNPSDSDPESYELFKNSTLLTSDSWTGSPITIELNGLDVGLHNYTLVVYDEQGHWVADTVLVNVVATTTPSTNTTTPEPSTPDTYNGLDTIMLAMIGFGVVAVLAIILVFVKRR